QAARQCIKDLYGKSYLPAQARDYAKKKVKGAQEAHEAIRPSGVEFVKPELSGLSGVQFKLYDLIWKRTIASQMVNAEQKQVSVKLSVGEAVFSASGMTIEFPGFLKAYVEGSDDPEATLENREIRLPKLKVGDSVTCAKIEGTEHETKPPARYTEASLVQRMEKDGIGRPSTYAAIISTIQDRGYVKKVGNALVPTFTALVVSKLLSEYLPNYVDVNFTSGMENSLDEIAQGEMDFVKYLDSVYFGKSGLKSSVETQEKQINDETSRSIQLEGLEELSFRIGRYGAYVCKTQKKTGEEICASLPENQMPGDITAETANKLIDQKINGTDALGKDPETGLPIYVLTGRYGPYVQLGDSEGEKEKPKRMAIPPSMDPESLNVKDALNLLSLPKTLGEHPETGKVIKVGLGRFGPYVVHDGDFRSIPKTENIFEVDFAKALELLSQPKKVRGRSTAIKELGKHPETEEAMGVYSGKYGPYVKCGKVNVSLPDDLEPENVTAEKAIELLAPKITASKKKTKKKSTGKKTTKKSSKKPTANKKVKSSGKDEDSSANKKIIRRRASSESSTANR
ncbi:MAG: DNA topoisomerase I, partial [Bdellovibrionales bacterium]|nr:DNA topoisomerase I [Bdellovibrionales bacterium]